MIDLHDPRVLAALNSATKYPSILTLHGLGQKGRLTEDLTLPWGDASGEVFYTEKVDGTNVRIILLPQDGTWLIGSRMDLLAAKGDIVHNPAMGIVEALSSTADGLSLLHSDGAYDDGRIRVLYGELYGHKVGAAAKEYTKEGQYGFRLFDVAYIPEDVLGWERDAIATWRDSGRQTFLNEPNLKKVSNHTGLELTPRLGSDDVSDMPTTHTGVFDMMTSLLPNTRVGLDVHGKSEGIVMRTADRRLIAKARFEDYVRTFKLTRV